MKSHFLIILLVSIVFISCETDDDIILKEFNTNRQLWESFEVKNYSWNESLSCFCGGVLDRDIFVVNGVKDHVEFDETMLPTGVTYEDIFKSTRTVEEAFIFIESLLNQDVAQLFISYDDVYGFPRSIGIDYEENAIDDEITYTYSNFEKDN